MALVREASTTNIPSEYRTASIDPNHAMILPHDANPEPDGIFGKDNAADVVQRVGVETSVLSRCSATFSRC